MNSDSVLSLPPGHHSRTGRRFDVARLAHYLMPTSELDAITHPGWRCDGPITRTRASAGRHCWRSSSSASSSRGGSRRSSVRCLPLVLTGTFYNTLSGCVRLTVCLWLDRCLSGLDAIFGAFLIGVILPRDEELVKVRAIRRLVVAAGCLTIMTKLVSHTGRRVPPTCVPCRS